MPSLSRYVLYTAILAAVAAGCSSGTDQTPSGPKGAGGSSGGTSGAKGGSTGTGGDFTRGSGGSAVPGDGGSTGTGGGFTTGSGGGGAAGMAGGATTGGASGTGTGGSVPTGGVAGTSGGTITGGSGGSQPSAGCGNMAAPKGAQNLTMQVAGKGRTYLLFVPSGYDATRPIPLIFAWHSSGATGAESRKYYNLESATGNGAIIVYPNGLNGGWDVSASGVDMKFFDQLLESISKDYCVDQSRVFSTGYSFGGIMSNSLACDRGPKLRGFAPVEGAFFDGAKSCPTPVPAWIVHASNDPTVSFASGEAARDIWLKANGCTTTTMPTTPSQCVAYQCTKAPVVWCVHTGGHIWPSFASKGVWAFFQSL
jgi:polyhydroxybutyrate depolymerase